MRLGTEITPSVEEMLLIRLFDFEFRNSEPCFEILWVNIPTYYWQLSELVSPWIKQSTRVFGTAIKTEGTGVKMTEGEQCKSPLPMSLNL
jgi:hypothetical protein